MQARTLAPVVIALLAITGLAGGSWAAPAATAETNVYRIPRTDLEIQIDGVLDEAAWEDALVIELNSTR